MNYESIDPIIITWAAKNTLHIYTTSHDEEVRSINFVGSNGLKCQLWIDAPDQSGNVQVHVWDYKRRRQDFKTAISDLAQCLEQAYETAMTWIV